MKHYMIYNINEEYVPVYEKMVSLLQKAEAKQRNIHIDKKLKLRRGRTRANESFWYTDYTWAPHKLRFMYYFEKCSEDMFRSVSEYEYEVNEFFFDKEGGLKERYINRDFIKDLISVYCVLVSQFKKTNQHFLIAIHINDVDINKAQMWLCFYAKRSFEESKEMLSRISGLLIMI